MEQVNFKKFQCEDGKEYIFDSSAFKKELRRSALAAKKANVIASIEEYEQGLADATAVSTASIKQWKAGRNGVSDIDRVKEIAEYLGLTDYKKLLTKVMSENREDDMNMGNNYICEDERKAAREVFYGFVDVIKAYKDTEAYGNCEGMYLIPSGDEVLEINDRVEVVIQKSRFDLPAEIHTQLEQLFFEITSTIPSEVDGTEIVSRGLVVERLGDQYFDDVCKILGRYIR